MYHVQEGLDHCFARCEVCVTFVLPPAVVSVEVSCHDDMSVIQYVVVREGVGEVFCHCVYGCIVVAVIVYIQHGNRSCIGGDLYPYNVGVLELDLFIAIC